jgi:hypothetical protein
MLAGMIQPDRRGLMVARLLWVVLAPVTLLHLIAGLPRLLTHLRS